MEAIRQNIDMIFYPAIDLKDGACVRLLRGEMDAATVFNDNPGAQSKAFEDQGAEYLHVVDLNGAFAKHRGFLASNDLGTKRKSNMMSPRDLRAVAPITPP